MKKNTPPLISIQFCAIAVAILIHAAACSSDDNNKITQAEEGKAEEVKGEKVEEKITINPLLSYTIEEIRKSDNFKKFKEIIRKNEEPIEGVKWTAKNSQELFNAIESISDIYKEFTLLMWAALCGKLAVVELLCENGADVNKTDDRGETALMWAALRGKLAVVELLCENGANVNKTDDRGETALTKAALRGKLAVVELLCKNGANVNEKDNNGETALMKAAFWGKLEVVEFLCENGANVNEKDNNGETALTKAALIIDEVEVVQFLVNKVNENQKTNALEIIKKKHVAESNSRNKNHFNNVMNLIEENLNENK